MQRPYPVIVVLLAIVATAWAPSRLHAAESYDSCTGFIDAVPATITTQGVWCLRKDLATAINSGNVITVANNNITIDCNGFKLGGLAAGNASQANGIYANARQNTTIRQCTIRGFRHGILLDGASGGGHLVEDNRMDNNLVAGIFIDGTRNLAQRNLVFDTGGATSVSSRFAISIAGDAIDNQVDGVYSATANSSVYGIRVSNAGTVRHNRVRNLTPSGAGLAHGISGGYSSGTSAVGNHVIAGPFHVNGNGLSGLSFCRDNEVFQFSTTYECSSLSGNMPAN